jgi:hypothetical protein
MNVATLRPYQNYSFSKMLRLKIFFTICKFEPLVNNLSSVYNYTTKILTKRGTNNLIGLLYGDILLGGMSIQDLEKCVKQQKDEKITCISGFVREALTQSEEGNIIDSTMTTHLESVDLMAKYDSENFIAIKVSCFCNKENLKRLNLLQKDLILIEDYFHENGGDMNALKLSLNSETAKKNLNENTLNQMKNELFNNSRTKFTINLYEIIINKETDKLQILTDLFGESLNAELVEYVKLTDERLSRLFSHAASKKVSILMDAEETYFQNIIDVMVMHYSKVYNRDYCLILHTIQQYLKEGPKALKEFIAYARENNFKMGMKMVKGAYLKIETKMAIEGGYENPINDTIEQTQDNYHNGVDTLFETIKEDEKVSFKDLTYN